MEWQPHPTAFARLTAAGVTVTVVNKREFRSSGLTIAAHRGADYVAERWTDLVVLDFGQEASRTVQHVGEFAQPGILTRRACLSRMPI